MTEAPCRQHQATQETQQDTSSEGLTEQPSCGTCRLCLEEDKISQLVSCCGCTGTCKYIHTR
jgi:E3 ubiquitin-protein ligase DOA10